RSFLKIAMGGATAAVFAPDASAASKRNLRKAIMYSTIGVKGSVLEKFRAMKEAGFEGVEPMGGMNRDEVLAALKETGLQAASVCDHIHWVKPLSAPDEATRKLGLDGLLQSLRDAHAYGAGSVLLVLGKRIVRIHVKDFSTTPAAAGARSERPKLLDGETNWPAVMNALDRAGYQGWAISEQPASQAADVETARDLAQRMDKIFAS